MRTRVVTLPRLPTAFKLQGCPFQFLGISGLVKLYSSPNFKALELYAWFFFVNFKTNDTLVVTTVRHR